MKTLPFNHFMMWCRNWYHWDDIEDTIKQAQKAIELDGYLEDNNAVFLALKAYDEITNALAEFNNFNYKSSDIVSSIGNHIRICDTSFNEAVILAIKENIGYCNLGDYKLKIAPEGIKGLKWPKYRTKEDITELLEIDNNIKVL
ncbi:MAG: hypothetical protein J1F35_08580 [Erysipelotrichales bacterium]|nr:hypothetical protein [Erysipelotrichales bacterium]